MFDSQSIPLFEPEELHGKLGCSVVYNPTYSYDLCNGIYCRFDSDCASDCCNYYTCESTCNLGLEWLWWTMSFLLLFCCIASCAAGARRRRMMAYRQAQLRN